MRRSSLIEAHLGNSSSPWEEAEARIAEFTGTHHAILCSSARAAIRLSLLALNVGHGSEVVIPDFACQILPITAFCVGAAPRFCDIDTQDLSPSPEQFEAAITPRTKAIIFVHLFGLPVDPSPILRIAQERGIALIDDAAQALGASLNDRKAGSFGDVGILCFNKFLEVGLGGAVTTNNKELADRVRSLRQEYESKSILVSSGYHLIAHLGSKSGFASKSVFRASNRLLKLTRVSLAKKHFRQTDGWVVPDPVVLEHWQHGKLTPQMIYQLMTYAGRYWHAREMDEYEIRQLRRELEKIDDYLQDRRRTAEMYKDLLESERFSAVEVKGTSSPAYLRYPVRVHDSRKLDKCVGELARAGFVIDLRYPPLHSSPFLNWISPGAYFPGSTHVYQNILPLPVYSHMDTGEVQKVVSIVKSVFSD